MGRTKTKKPTSRVTTRVTTAAAPTPAPSIESLLEKAQVLLAQCNYDLGRKFLSRILEREPTQVDAREMLGLVEIEEGEVEAAKQVFRSLIPPSPTAPSSPPASAYLYLAQLEDGDPNTALDLYRSGLNILTSDLKGKGPAPTDPSAPDVEAQLKKTAVETIVAMVELWMTDLCFEPQAESECETLLKLALELDTNSPESLQALASVRISQQRPDEAQSLAEKSWALWRDLEHDDAALPSIPSRLALTRLFIELSLYPAALTIIEGILASDEAEVEAWYLQGWCFFLMGERVKEGTAVEGTGDLTAQELKQDARDYLETCRQLHQTEQHPDAQILEHVTELIGELEAEGIHPSPELEEKIVEPKSDDEWVDEDEDDEDVEMS